MRKLAEQSQEAAKQIASLISGIQNQTENAVLAMNAGTAVVEAGASEVKTTGERFNAIVNLVQNVSKDITTVVMSVEDVVKGGNAIQKAVSNIENVSKETMEQTQMVSATTEEQNASMQEIASSSQALARMAHELQVAVAHFKV